MAQLLTRMVKMLFQKSHSGNVDAAAMTALMAPSTTGKGRSSRGDKARASDSDAACPRKRGNNSSSDTESGPSEQEMDGDPTTQDSYGNGHSPKVPPLKIVLPSSGTGNLEGTEPAGGANSKERKVSSSKPALPYVVNAAESLSEGSPSEQAVEEKERRREEERCQRVTRSSHRAALTHEEEVEDAPEVHPRKRKLRAREDQQQPQQQQQSPQQQQQQSPQQQQQQQQSTTAAAAAITAAAAAATTAAAARAAATAAANTATAAGAAAAAGRRSFSFRASNPHRGSESTSHQWLPDVLDIRKQVEKRRQAMLVVHPKPPQGFKDYLLNRGSYVLEGNPSSRLSVPMVRIVPLC
ncbi:LOW QUALITY PROTEIN: uncharacterized protein LOC119462445 [Dermacentor silvarum]|uniref:LOW QUALITY PROTEIN: uncharacterized protein LOC119462445 n=1 Tax=Dermacentor silvarum TaxID=543639 RepID=UPI002101D403|nr:LOW QUALITY PROTEIN: uncharacterized protein LOC119462445 [Dermacentor silvarum]